MATHCLRSTGRSITNHNLIIPLISFKVMQLYHALELFTTLMPPARCKVLHGFPAPTSWAGCHAGFEMAPYVRTAPHHNLRCHLQHVCITFLVYSNVLALSTAILITEHRKTTEKKNQKSSGTVELTACHHWLENVTGHTFHNTSKIALKPSDSYLSLIFHYIPPNELISPFCILQLRTTYLFPTHPEQPLCSELSPNPPPNTTLLPDRSPRPSFYPSDNFLASILHIPTVW